MAADTPRSPDAPSAVSSGAAPSTSSAASPLFLREEEIRRGLELLHAGQARLFAAADTALRREGLGRAHQRALYFIARRPGLSVGALLDLLGITKQSLGRALRELSARGLVETRAGTTDRRRKLLTLTDTGAALEAELFAALRSRLADAYEEAGQESVTGFWRVLEGLLPDADRALWRSLREEKRG